MKRDHSVRLELRSTRKLLEAVTAERNTLALVVHDLRARIQRLERADKLARVVCAKEGTKHGNAID